jgi:hypothetical protein
MQTDLERLWARLLTDPELRARFLADAFAVARQEGLSREDSVALTKIPASDLQVAARSYAFKRGGKSKRSNKSWISKIFLTGSER